MEEKQIIISIGREYGSAGHEIAAILAEKLNLPLYDHNLMDEISRRKNVESANLSKYDEVPRSRFFSRNVKGHNNSPEQAVAKMQFDYLRERAETGESFIVVGRCSEHLFKDYPGLISFFIGGDMDKKINRIRQVRNMTEEQAKAAIAKHDRKRKAYHDYYSESGWGDARTYDVTLNSSRLGIEETVDTMLYYIEKRRKCQ